MSRRRDLIKHVLHGRPHVHIGKSGLSEGVLNEIDRQLEENEVIKVRFLRSALLIEGCDRDVFIKLLAEKLNAKILDVRGLTVILYRRRRLYKR